MKTKNKNFKEILDSWTWWKVHESPSFYSKPMKEKQKIDMKNCLKATFTMKLNFLLLL